MADVQKRSGLLGVLASNLDTIAAVAKFLVPASFTGALVGWATWFAGIFQQYAPASYVVAGLIGALLGALIMLLTTVARERLQLIRFRNSAFDASGINPLDTTYQQKRIRVVDLAPPVGFIIEGKTFIDCDIVGPVNLVFADCIFHGNSGVVVDAVVVKQGLDPQHGYGFRNCIFRQCRFFSVTFLVREQDYHLFNVDAHRGLNWITERPDQPPLKQVTNEAKAG
jgi:hypothetical protein